MYSCLDESECIANLYCAELNRDQWDGMVKQPNDVEEPTRNVLSDDDGDVFVLRVALSLDIPILNGPDNVRLVEASKLQFNGIAPIAIRIGKQQIEPPARRLRSFAANHVGVPQPKPRRVVYQEIMQPALVVLGMAFEADVPRLHKFHVKPAAIPDLAWR